MKKKWIIVTLGLFLVLTLGSVHARESLQGQTEVLYWDETNAYNGYTLFAARGTTYLIDMEGRVVNTWPVGTNPRLLEDGHLLDAATDDPSGFDGFQELDWEGNVVWEYDEERDGYDPHHDFVRIFNQELGEYTTLYIANKSLTHEECIAAGCDPDNGPYDGAQMDAIVEVDMDGNVVWEWWFFDHVVQDIDPAKDNYVGAGMAIADYPGRIDLNLPGRPVKRDWLHCNSLDYNEELDQIVTNSVQGEFYVIDHGNTFIPGDPEGSTALASSEAGDFLYRFGDPARYEQGDPPSVLEDWTQATTGHKQIGGSHDIQWIGTSLPGEGNFLVFNNGQYLFERTPQSYIFEINGFLDAAGNDTGDYVNPPDAGYYIWDSPKDTHKLDKEMSNQIVWIYNSKSNQGLFSHIGSGAQRLPNGNTLICAMTEGHIFEVTAAGDLVWEYINPVTSDGILEIIPDNYPMYNSVFRAYRYGPDFSGFVGKDMTPGDTITGQDPSYGQFLPVIIRATQGSGSDSAGVTSNVADDSAMADSVLTHDTDSDPNIALQTVPEGMVLIPSGEFVMGDHHNLGGGEHPNDEVPTHTVYIEAFYMATTETTNQQYADYLNVALAQGAIEVDNGAVYGASSDDLYYETHAAVDYGEIAWDGSTFAVLNGRDGHPVIGIRWKGAAAYANWLSVQHGYPGCYDSTTWDCDFSQAGYRLPTEAEWEYAGRGGLHAPYAIFPWGDDAATSKANWPGSGDPYETDSYPWTTLVGFYNGDLHLKADFGWPGSQDSYQTGDGSNGYGLYDMAGNVWEWVNDWYGRDYYSVSPYDNPTGPDGGTPAPDGQAYHALRGGNWYNGEWGHSRVSNRNLAYYRGPDDPEHAWYHVGFRVVLDEAPPSPDSTLFINEFMADSSTGGEPVDQTVGLFLNDAGAFEGYTLFAPKHYSGTYLIDNEGNLVHSWTGSEYEPGQSVYLLENGHLLRACFVKGSGLTGGGEGGRIEEYDWQGNLVWAFDYATSDYTSHHDIEPLPNGNILMLVVEKKSYAEVLAAGFDPSLLHPDVSGRGYMLPDSVVEIEPNGTDGGTVVWEWHVWDHLIQDYDSGQQNYGTVADHPELVDVNGSGGEIHPFWNHMNSIDYNADLDQILLSVRGNDEIWIIDHSTTTAEAAGHTGGNSGKGGDLLYRWGNPQAYKAGSPADQQLFEQHDAQWIEAGLPGEGNILIFNNGNNRPGGSYSSVDEIVSPVDANGNYTDPAPGSAYGPAAPLWIYTADPPTDLFSEAISGAGRLPNGNTLICDGVHGTFLEVTPAGEVVWEYVNPVVNTGPLVQGEEIALDHRGHQLNAVFKIQRYAPDYAGLVGQDLTPGSPIEGYPSQGDWIEIYNAGSQAVDLGGLYLTDDLGQPTRWQIPAGVSVETGGYLLFWADNGAEPGDTHTNFELDARGEAIGLFDADGTTLTDAYTFGPQTTDVSEGRCPDGSDAWRFFETATPGAPNGPCSTAYAYLPLVLKDW